MEKEIKRLVSDDGESIYYPADGPWPGPYMDRAWAMVLAEYEELIKTRKPVYLMTSSHWCTEGYWIEFEKPTNMSVYDNITKSHE